MAPGIESRSASPRRIALASLIAAGAAALIPTVSVAAAPAANKCVLEKVGEIALEGGRYRPVVTAVINGKPMRLLVDTGSYFTLLFPEGAAKLGLTPHIMPNMKMYGVGGESGAFTVNIDTLEVGGLKGRDIDLMVSGQERNYDTDGVLGAGFLLQTDVEFDLADKRLRFFKPRGCRGDQVVYWNTPYAVTPLLPPQDRALKVAVMVNGTPVRAQLDTGSPHSSLIPESAERAGIKPFTKDAAMVGVARGLGPQAVAVSQGIFSSFAFGDEVIHNAALDIADMFQADTVEELGSRLARPAVDAQQMLIGADFFHAHRIYIAESQHKIYVSYIGGPVFETAPRRPEAKTAPVSPKTSSDGEPPKGSAEHS
jgi:clan AA aspartic protease (TIGR02281 family)